MNIPNKYCHSCGKLTLPASKFCSSCGTSLASIDEKPPGAVPAPEVPNRVAPRRQTTFTPVAVGAEEDMDDEVLRVDRINSINDLNLNFASLDVDIRVDQTIRESVAGLMSQGAGMKEGYKEPPRQGGAVDTKAVLQQLSQEGGTLRQK